MVDRKVVLFGSPAIVVIGCGIDLLLKTTTVGVITSLCCIIANFIQLMVLFPSKHRRYVALLSGITATSQVFMAMTLFVLFEDNQPISGQVLMDMLRDFLIGCISQTAVYFFVHSTDFNICHGFQGPLDLDG